MKRIWSIILTLCLLAGMAPPFTKAAETPTPADTAALSSDVDVVTGRTITESTTSGGTYAVDVGGRTGDAQDAANSQDAAEADSDTLSGTCGDNLTWTLSNGTLTISGTGPMADYSVSSPAPWYGSRASIQTVIIERGVTSVGQWVFAYCTSLANLTILNGVTVLDNGAFWGCINLSNVTIPDSVARIGTVAFEGCIALTDVVIPDSVTETGTAVFQNCINLSSVTIPVGVTSIKGYTFHNCGALTDVHYRGTRAQWNAVTIHDNENGNTALRSATVHCTDGDIPGETPTNSDNLSGICGDNLAWTLSNGVLTISGAGAMTDYDASVSGRMPWYHSRASIGRVSIGLGVTSIGRGAFFDCSRLAGVTIPDSVSAINRGAFYRCNALAEVHYGGTEAQWAILQRNIAADNDPLLNATIHYSGAAATFVVTFNGNGGIPESSSVTVPSGGIATPPANPTRDGYEFAGWYTAPQATTAFDFTTPITANTTLYAGWRPVTPPDVLSQGACGANLTYVLRTDGTLTISGTGSMTDYSASTPAPWYANRQSVRAVVVESGVSSVGAYAFGDCSALSALTLPNSVASVAPHAFDGCGVLESVSYDGTQEQWDAVIFGTADNDALEFATVRCGDETYSAYRALGFFGTDGKMDAASEQTWRFPVPLDRFRNLYIDAPDVENAPAENTLDRKASPGELSHAEGSKEYAATSGSTVLTIPAETFETFKEGSHSIAATFQDSRGEIHPVANVYTIFPNGPIDINTDEFTAQAVQDVSYTGRLQTSPKLSDKFYKFTITAATRDGQALPVTRQSGGTETVNEEANDVQKIGDQKFYFHPNGRFSGIPSLVGTYELTVELQVRREIDDPWYTPEGTQPNPRVVTIVVAQKTADNITVTSEGYDAPPFITHEEGTPFQIVITKDPADRLTAVYIDSELLEQGPDYTVFEQPIPSQLLAGSLPTQLYINGKKTDIPEGTHSVNVEFEHTDPLGNTQTKNVARPDHVTPRRAATPVNTGSSSSGSSGGSRNSGSSGSSGSSSRSTTPTVRTYTVKVSKASHGTLTLSATKVAAGKSVTITAAPNSGYRTESVSVTDSAKKAVKTTQSGNRYTFTMPSRNVTVSASFTPSVYTLTVANSAHGKVTMNRTSASRNTTINGSTTPDKGYLLSSVAVRDANGQSVNVETFNDGKFTFLMPNGRVTVVATFAVKRLAKFADIQGPDWFFDDAEWAYNRGILRGVTERYWEPQSLMSSITSIVTLERLDGVDLTPYDTGADDGLDNSAWYVAALRWANANGITLSDRPFGGQAALKRGEFAVMLSNYLRYRGIAVEVPEGATFSDAATMTEDELRAFRTLQAADVFRGYRDGSIRPEAYLNRAQLAALLHRLSGYIIGAETA